MSQAIIPRKLWQAKGASLECGSPRRYRVSYDVRLRCSIEQVVDLLAYADVPYRDAEFFRDGDDDSALRRPVELRKHQPRHGHGARELTRLLKPVLTRDRVDDEKDFV